MESLIQRFEYTYELSIKMLKRYLREKAIESKETLDSLSFNNMIRISNQYGLLKSDLKLWSSFRDMRNITSHTYDEEKAFQVISVIQDFIDENDFLLNKLKEQVE